MYRKGEQQDEDDGLGESDNGDAFFTRGVPPRGVLDDLETNTGGSVRSASIRRPPSTREYPSSRLWEAPAFSRIRQGVSRGWKTHESVMPQTRLGDVYAERDEDLSEESEEINDPPSFLSPAPEQPNEPLLQPRTLHIYPSTSRGGARSQYQDAPWIAAYGLAFFISLVTGLRILWVGSDPSPSTPSMFSALPTLAFLSFLSLLAGISSVAYLLSIRSAVRHLVSLALLLGPVILVGCGIFAWAGSLFNSGAEADRGWKIGVRWFGAACFLAAFLLARMGLQKRQSVARTIKVLELASSIVMAHPPLILLGLGLSVLSTVLTIPFLFVFAGILSSWRYLGSWATASWSSLALLGFYLWTLAILRGLQRVTVAGVVGAWYFERHEASHPSTFEVTKASFARATGPSLGTIIASSFILAVFETIEVLLRRAQAALRSSRLPTYLHPLTCLVPLLSIATAALDIFTGYVLCYAGLSGDEFMESARKVKRLINANGTSSLSENLLVKSILFVYSFLWGLAAGIIAFFIASSRLSDARFAPSLALLSFLVPMWTLKLCQGIVGDAADTLFIAFNIDLERQTVHCNKAVEAFETPDSDFAPRPVDSEDDDDEPDTFGLP